MLRYNLSVFNGFKTKIMDKYKIKDYTERLKKETYKNAQKMIYMWIKQDVISLNEYRTLVKNINVIQCCKSDSELCCEPVGEGFYLGTTCPKCKQPFRQNLK